MVGAYNMLVRLANNIDKAWSNIDVILKQRHDELPSLSKSVTAMHDARAGRPWNPLPEPAMRIAQA